MSFVQVLVICGVALPGLTRFLTRLVRVNDRHRPEVAIAARCALRSAAGQPSPQRLCRCWGMAR